MRGTLIGIVATLALAVSAAQARSVCYAGAQADNFIAQHFPNASIPGDVKGPFADGPHGRHGFAKCHVPAMGERSDGGVSVCYVRF